MCVMKYSITSIKSSYKIGTTSLILRQLWLHSEMTEELILFCLHRNLIDMTQMKIFGTRHGQLLELFLYIPGGLVVLDESMGNLH